MPLSTNIFTGVASGLARGSQSFSPRAQADREEARVRKAQGELELERLNMRTEEDTQLEADVMREELRNTKLQLKQQNNQLTQQKIYGAFDRYTGDYDVRHLNQGLQDARNQGSTVFGDTARVDRLADSEADRNLIRQAGLDPDLILNSETLMRQWVKTTDEDGTQSLQDIQETFVMTGYERYAGDREIERQIKAAQLHQDHSQYSTASERQIARLVRAEGLQEGTPEFEQRFSELYDERETGDSRLGGTEREREALSILRAEGLTEGDEGFDARFSEVMSDLRDAQRTTRSSRQEREVERRLEAQGITPDDPNYSDRYVEVLDDVIERERQTASSRDLDEVEQAKNTIDQRAEENFGTDFFNIDFDNPANRRRFENEINRIERLGGLGFDAQDKRELSYVKSLLAMGEPAQDLTDREVGLVDNVLRDVSRYISNNTDGTEARAAYNAFRNVLRHSLYGSVQTEENIRSFNDQFGNLSQQRGPILSQFNTALRQLRGRLEGVANLNDSYVIHYRLGADQNHLSRIIDSLDDEIQRMNRMASEEGIELDPSTGLDEESRQQLDQLFQESDQ